MNQNGAPVMQATPQPQTGFVDPRVAMRGGAPGGRYENEKYCGIITILLGLIFWCPCVVSYSRIMLILCKLRANYVYDIFLTKPRHAVLVMSVRSTLSRLVEGLF